MTHTEAGTTHRRFRRRAVPWLVAFGVILPAGHPALSRLEAGEDSMSRVTALREAGHLEEALAAATEALRTEPGRRDLRLERAYLLGALRRYDEALAEYERILAVDPADVEALLEHAQIKTLQGKYDEAEGEFRFILELAPGLPGANFGLGDVLTWKQDFAGARLAYLEYIRARPEDPRGHLRLGHVAILMGDAAEGRARFREALRLDPANAEARTGLERVDRLVARKPRFRLELGYTHDTLTHGQPDWRQGAALLSVRPWSGTEMYVGGQAVNRFGTDDQAVTVGFSQDLTDRLTLSADATKGLDGRVLAKETYDGQLALQVAPPVQLFTSYTYAHFNGDLIATTVSPGIQVSLPWRFTLLGRYLRTDSTDNDPANAWLVQISHDTTERFHPYLGYGHGGLAAGARTSAEFLNANSQYQSIFAGFAWRVFSRFGIKVDYAYQGVKNVYVRQSFGLSTFVEF